MRRAPGTARRCRTYEPSRTVWQNMTVVEDVHRGRIATGAVGLGEIADGSLAPLGTVPVTNGDPETGIVDVPGARLAVLQLADGSKLGLRQSLPATW